MKITNWLKQKKEQYEKYQAEAPQRRAAEMERLKHQLEKEKIQAEIRKYHEQKKKVKSKLEEFI